MIFEFIATITAGFACAGVALIIRQVARLFKYETAKWLTPLFVAMGIFMFQIHQEYNWYDQTAQQLPSHINVVKEVESQTWYKPWSYVKPQIIRFMAIDVNPTAIQTTRIVNDEGVKDDSSVSNLDMSSEVYLVNVYLFERRMSTKKMTQLINCQQSSRADISPQQIMKTSLDTSSFAHTSSNNSSTDVLSKQSATITNEMVQTSDTSMIVATKDLAKMHWYNLSVDNPLITSVCV